MWWLLNMVADDDEAKFASCANSPVSDNDTFIFEILKVPLVVLNKVFVRLDFASMFRKFEFKANFKAFSYV
jgi:hypothetical protein